MFRDGIEKKNKSIKKMIQKQIVIKEWKSNSIKKKN